MEYKKIITIDSAFREEKTHITTSGDFWVPLKDNIINVISMKLHDIIIPFSWYRFSEGQCNNKLVIHHALIPGCGSTTTYILDSGNYNSLADICCNLKTKAGVHFDEKYCLYHDIITKKVTISSENDCLCNGSGSGTGLSFSIKPSEQLGYEKRSLAWILGFHKPAKCVTSHTSEGIFLIGQGVRYRYFYLVVDDYKNIGNFIAEPLDRGKYINDFILARLIIQIQDNISTQFSFEEYTRIYNGPCDINKLHIKLIDEWGDVVDLNNMEFSLSLELSIKL